ncbi:uncharacterized protein EAE98_001613 [Botrytis deweyae]|uniref:F-box domain-containing protein n=1 Tax=Botrytis deweyae TaxID=2478750 RepID=A0ABQ7IYD0_9HELO|nr:uncharacterized protein EAE98_001613 [Botrytis deweyae]KAF7937299.1 hypothetical protein EAE98_001613 [Botrytis deweyae]
MQRSSKKRPDLRNIRVAIPYSLQHGIASKFTPTSSATATTKRSKPTLLKIPREIRDQIMNNLLMSHALGTGASLCTKLNGTDIPTSEEIPRYFLHTSILSVCKQLYEEGSKVLYEGNEFIVDCLESENARPKLGEVWSSDHVCLHDNLDVYSISDTLVVSPVTRLLGDSHFTHATCTGISSRVLKRTFRQSRFQQISRIKKWKVLVRCALETYGMYALLQFCRAVCEIPGLEITFLLVGTEKNKNERIDSNNALRTWHPLKLLRNVAVVEFREATGDEIPEYMFYHGSWDDYHCKGFLSTVNSLEEHVALMKGSLPLNSTESIHLQYDRLLAYAQAFECNPEFRADLDLPPDINAKLPRWGCPNNVFRAKHIHQIEESVDFCRREATNSYSNIDFFRWARHQALLELEKQYEAINRHAFNLNEFIKSEKRFEGFFGLAGWKLKTALTRPYYGTGEVSADPRLSTNEQYIEAHQESLRDDWWDRSTEALLLLEEYADSFARKLSFQQRIEFRKYDIASLYNHLPRARLLENLKQAYKYRAYDDFVQWFKKAVDDMDGQLIEIRKARQRLFDYDRDEKTERGIKIDYREFGFVNWGVSEPDMRVRLTIDKAREMRIYDVRERYYP